MSEANGAASTFSIGQEIGGFRVEQVLGASEGGTSYLVKDPSGNRLLVMKTLAVTNAESAFYENLRDYVQLSSEVRHKNLGKVYGLGREGNVVFVAMEFIQGQTLAQYAAQRRANGEPFSPKNVYNIITRICNALQHIHTRTVHGAITPSNIYVTSEGRIKIGNMAYGRYVAEVLRARRTGVYHDSAFTAPELRGTQHGATPASDVYSAAMLSMELLSPQSLESTGEQARNIALQIARGYGDATYTILERSTRPNPAERPPQIGELRDHLRAICEEREEPVTNPGIHEPPEDAPERLVGLSGIPGFGDDGNPVSLSGGSAFSLDNPMTMDGEALSIMEESPLVPAPPVPASAPAPPPTPLVAAQEKEEEEEDLFARAAEILGNGPGSNHGPRSAPSSTSGTHGERPRFLVSRDGLDYGPFTQKQVLAQLYKDEIDEFTPIMDRDTQLRTPMGEMPEFYDEVLEYIPKRAERRRKEAEARAQTVETVKKAGKWTGGVGVAAALLLGAAMAFYWFFVRPQPAPIPTENLVASLGSAYKMAPPPRDFNQIALGDDLLKDLFAVAPTGARKGRRVGKGRGRHGAGGRGHENDENISTLDLTNEGSVDHTLTDAEIQRTIRRYSGGLRRCMTRELKRDPNFRGVSIKFFIKGTGTTGGVKIVESGASGSLSRCLKGNVRSMQFPRHSGFNKGVTLPFYIK